MPQLIKFDEKLFIQNHIAKLYDDDVRELLQIVKEEIDKSEEIRERYSLLNDDKIPEFVKNLFLISRAWELAQSTMGVSSDVVDGKGRVNYDILEDYLIKKFAAITFSKIIYIYTGSKYVDNEGQIEKECKKVLRRFGITEKRKIASITNEIMYRISITTRVYNYPFNNLENFIPLENGVLYVDDGMRILLPNSPVYGFTYSLPVKYDPDAKCPNIQRFLKDIAESEEDAQVLAEIPALCLIPEHYPYSYMLIGRGRNGKTTYLTLIRRFIGDDNISGISLQDLNNKFRAYMLVGKLANICGDLPRYAIKDTGMFKMATGGDPITVEKKFKDPFHYYNRAVFIFAANELPDVLDRSDAFFARWILLRFPKRFKENPRFIDTLTTEEELSGFLNIVIDNILKIRREGVTITKTMQDAKDEWLRKSNSVYAFVQDMVEKSPDLYVTNDELYNSYKNYCDVNALTIFPRRQFTIEFERMVPYARRDNTKIAKRSVRIWRGITLKTIDEAEENKPSGPSTLDSYDQTTDTTHTTDNIESPSSEQDTEEVSEEPEIEDWDLTDMIDDVESVESKHAIVLDIVRDLCDRFKSGASLKKIVKAAKEREIDEKEVDEILNKLVEYGKVVEIKGKYKIVE